MATLLIINGIEYDADTVIIQFLTSKGKNGAERAALYAEYQYANDMSAWVEGIIERYQFKYNNLSVELVKQA